MMRRILIAGLLLVMSAGVASAHPLMRETRVWEVLHMGSPFSATDWLRLDTDPETRYPVVFELRPRRAAGSDGLKVNAVQSITALTGGLHAGYFVAQPGTVGGTGSAKLMALELKTRQPDSAVPYHSTLYISADAKDQDSTAINAIEISLDGDPGGDTTTTRGIVVYGNSSGTLGASSAYSVNAGAVSGHNTFDADFEFQQGATLDEQTDAMLDLDGAYLDIQRTMTSQTTENNSLVIDLTTDSTYLGGSNITYSGGYGNSAVDVSGTFSGVNGGGFGVLALITNSAAHTDAGAGVIAVKGVSTNTAQLADGNIYGGMFWAKHNHASNDMLASAALIGLEGMAYPSNVGHVQTLIGVNAGYHIEATTENHEAGSVARGIQVVCDDASSNTDPVEETGICIWNMTGDQDHVFNVTHSASGFTNFVYAPTVSGCFSADTGTVPSTSTHKIKVLMGSTTGYIPVHADW